VNVVHGDDRQLGEQENAAVHERAGGCVVVQRNERVHLELGRAEQTLNHAQTDSLEDDAAGLEEESSHDELDLAEGSNDDTHDNEGDIAERLHVRWVDTHAPGREQDGNRSGGLRGVSACLATRLVPPRTLSI